MMDDSGTLPVPIGAGGNRALSTLDQLAEIPEEDIWLAKQRAGDVRAGSRLVADSPVEHLTPSCNLNVNRTPSSSQLQLTARSGTIEAMLFCFTRWSYMDEVVEHPHDWPQRVDRHLLVDRQAGRAVDRIGSEDAAVFLGHRRSAERDEHRAKRRPCVD